MHQILGHISEQKNIKKLTTTKAPLKAISRCLNKTLYGDKKTYQFREEDRSTDVGIAQICKKKKSSKVKARSRLSWTSVKHENVVFKTSAHTSSPIILMSRPVKKNAADTNHLKKKKRIKRAPILPGIRLISKRTISITSWFGSFSSSTH